MHAMDTLKYLLFPLRGASLILIPQLLAARYEDAVARRIAGQLAGQLER